MRRWPLFVIAGVLWTLCPAQAAALAPDTPAVKATFTARPVPGGVVIRNLSAGEVTVQLVTPRADDLEATNCAEPYDYPLPDARTGYVTLATGEITCVPVKDATVAALTLYTESPFYQVHLEAAGLQPLDGPQLTSPFKNGLALYAQASRGPTQTSCPSALKTAHLINTAGQDVKVCLNAYGRYEQPLGDLRPGLYLGKLPRDRQLNAEGADVPVSLTVRGHLFYAVALIISGVVLGLVPPFLQEQSARNSRRKRALAAFGVTDTQKFQTAGCYYRLLPSGADMYAEATSWWEPITDLAFDAKREGLTEFSRVQVLQRALSEALDRLRSSLPNWKGVAGHDAAAIRSLDRVASGEANYLHTMPMQLNSDVTLDQAKTLAQTLEEALRLAYDLRNLKLQPGHYADPVQARRLLSTIYREAFSPFTVEDIKAYRERLATLRVAADAEKAPAAAGFLLAPGAGAPSPALQALAPLGNRPAPEALVALPLGQRTAWLLVLLASLIIAVGTGLLELYVGRPWGATTWDAVKALLWGAGTGAAVLLATNLTQALSSRTMLGALLKRVKLPGATA